MAKKEDIYFIPEGSPVAPDKFDVRVRLRNLTNGVVTPASVEKYYASLPDDSELAEFRSFDSIVHDETPEEEEELAADSAPLN